MEESEYNVANRDSLWDTRGAALGPSDVSSEDCNHGSRDEQSNDFTSYQDLYANVESIAMSATAAAAGVVWARVKGFPYWPGQILSDEAAAERLGGTKRAAKTLPILFFGTLEVAWCKYNDVCPWRHGVDSKMHTKGYKRKNFLVSLREVFEYLHPDKPRAPEHWWCDVPSESPASCPSHVPPDWRSAAQKEANPEAVGLAKKKVGRPVGSGRGPGRPPGPGRGPGRPPYPGGPSSSHAPSTSGLRSSGDAAPQATATHGRRMMAINDSLLPNGAAADAGATGDKPIVGPRKVLKKRKMIAIGQPTDARAPVSTPNGSTPTESSEPHSRPSSGSFGRQNAKDGRPVKLTARISPSLLSPSKSPKPNWMRASAVTKKAALLKRGKAVRQMMGSRVDRLKSSPPAPLAESSSGGEPVEVSLQDEAPVGQLMLRKFENGVEMVAVLKKKRGRPPKVPRPAEYEYVPVSELPVEATEVPLRKPFGRPPKKAKLLHLASNQRVGTGLQQLHGSFQQHQQPDGHSSRLTDCDGAVQRTSLGDGAAAKGEIGETRESEGTAAAAQSGSMLHEDETAGQVSGRTSPMLWDDYFKDSELQPGVQEEESGSGKKEADARQMLAAPDISVEMRDRQPEYEIIKRSIWVSRPRPKRLAKHTIQVCSCTPPRNLNIPSDASEEVPQDCCGENCLNRLSFLLCDHKSCPCGPRCSNRPFHQLVLPRSEPFLTTSRGWGLRAMEDVHEGEFIMEYVGEIVDTLECQKRMREAKERGEPHFYMMELAPGLVIDARYKGNPSRLINSSCSPNCETQKWHDAATGEVRIGLFALQHIRAGTELTYDYQFQHAGLATAAGAYRCMCGAPSCRGTVDKQPERLKDWGKRLEVYWEAQQVYYRGTITGYSTATGKHSILYDDMEIEKVVLHDVCYRWLDESTPRCPDPREPDTDDELLEEFRQRKAQKSTLKENKRASGDGETCTSGDRRGSTGNSGKADSKKGKKKRKTAPLISAQDKSSLQRPSSRVSQEAEPPPAPPDPAPAPPDPPKEPFVAASPVAKTPPLSEPPSPGPFLPRLDDSPMPAMPAMPAMPPAENFTLQNLLEGLSKGSADEGGEVDFSDILNAELDRILGNEQPEEELGDVELPEGLGISGGLMAGHSIEANVPASSTAVTMSQQAARAKPSSTSLPAPIPPHMMHMTSRGLHSGMKPQGPLLRPASSNGMQQFGQPWVSAPGGAGPLPGRPGWVGWESSRGISQRDASNASGGDVRTAFMSPPQPSSWQPSARPNPWQLHPWSASPVRASSSPHRAAPGQDTTDLNLPPILQEIARPPPTHRSRQLPLNGPHIQ